MDRTSILAEVMLWLMGAGLLAAICAVVWSVVLTIRRKVKRPQRKTASSRWISLAVMVGTLLLLILSFLFASPASLLINGSPYTDSFWLRVADMFIISTAVLAVVAVVALVVGKLRNLMPKP
ncbi:MAG: hypothetical protein IJ605_03165 [Prevotella sp.]|nr:hypothetical protein [Prevotella sp.]